MSAMKAIVVKINWDLPMCEVVTANKILVAFRPTDDRSISIGDTLELDLAVLGMKQDVLNLTKSRTIKLQINRNDVHDLSLPFAHGTSRFPSSDKLVEQK